MTKIVASQVKRILCIKLRGMGDVILSSIVFDTLRKRFPDAAIDYLTEPPGAETLKELDFISDIISFNRKEGSSPKLLRKIRRKKYSLVLDFYSNPRTALITFLSGAPLRAGFPYRGRKYAYNLFGPPERDKYHAAELHLEFLRSIGVEPVQSSLHFGLGETERRFADDFINKNFAEKEKIIALCPSGGWKSKKCDPVKFAEIGDRAAEEFSAQMLLLWGPGDEKDAGEISELMQKPLIKAPPTGIRQLGAIIEKCDLIIANDSGPMHIAAAVGTPVIGLFGPTNPEFQGPYGSSGDWVQLTGLNCIRCNETVCPKNHECFLELPVEKVLERCHHLLKKGSNSL